MRHLPGVLFVSSAVGWFFACATPEYLGGRCAEDEHCHTDMNPHPDGTVCGPSDTCECPLGTKECCPKGSSAGACTTACLVPDQCAEDGAGGSGAGGGSGGGGGGGVCSTDSQCPQPVEAECGEGTCVKGTCKLSIHKGPLPSQRYGDCKRRECDLKVVVVEVDDSSDFYNDLNQCTIDFCKDSTPMSFTQADGSPCSGGGYCYQEACVECIQWMGGASCSGNHVCDTYWCVPVGQCAGDCGGVCSVLTVRARSPVVTERLL